MNRGWYIQLYDRHNYYIKISQLALVIFRLFYFLISLVLHISSFLCLSHSKDFFAIRCFLTFSICSALNATFKFVERKLMVMILSTAEDNNIFSLSKKTLSSWSRLFLLLVTIRTVLLINYIAVFLLVWGKW